MDLQAWVGLIELGLKIVAVLGAGVWAVALLFLLRQRELSQAALRRSEAEIRDFELKARHVDAQIRELELKAKQQAVVRVDIQAAIRASGSGHIILAVVELTNRGGRNTKIKWRGEPPAFYVRFAELGGDGKPHYGPATECRVPLTVNPEFEPISHVIRAGGTESIPFAVRVASPGLYLLSFRGLVDEQERAEAQELGVEMPVAWTGNRHVLVGDAPAGSTSEAAVADPGFVVDP
jgi:hypothetical protein